MKTRWVYEFQPHWLIKELKEYLSDTPEDIRLKLIEESVVRELIMLEDHDPALGVNLSDRAIGELERIYNGLRTYLRTVLEIEAVYVIGNETLLIVSK